jgi:hypothetical protein
MIPRVILPLVLTLGLLCLPGTGQAKSKPRPTPAHHHVTIESVSATSITVSQPGGVVTYKITPSTEITFAGQTTTVDQLQSGMRVQIIPDAADDTAAGEIQADAPPVDPTPRPRIAPPKAPGQYGQ